MPDRHPLTEADLLAIEARARNATSGPWEARGATIASVATPPALLAHYVLEDAFLLEADRVFIAAARSDVPRLVEEIRQLRQVLKNRQDWG